jgi:hypothetical protein
MGELKINVPNRKKFSLKEVYKSTWIRCYPHGSMYIVLSEWTIIQGSNFGIFCVSTTIAITSSCMCLEELFEMIVSKCCTSNKYL